MAPDAPGPARGGRDDLVGIVLIVVAVLIGILLLVKGYDEEGGVVATSEPSGEVSSTTTTEPVLPTTLPSNAPADVSVLIANASGIGGAAGATQETLNAAGYTTTRTANAPSVVPSTQVLYVEGSQGDAQAVATALELDATVVQPMPEPVPLALEGATVLVLVGPDLS